MASNAAAPLRVVEVVNSLDFGGTERLVVDLAKALKSHGHEVRVVCLRNTGPLEEPLRRAGIEVMELRKTEGPSGGTLLRFVRYLRRDRTDVIHTHNPLVHHYGVVGGRLAGVRAVVNTIHGIGNLSEQPGLKEALYSLMCRLSSKVIAVCPMAYRVFAEGGVIPRNKLQAINNGIPLDPFLRVSRTEGTSPFTFGIVGRLVPVKNHRSLLDAFGQVVRVRPNCRLEILGDGPLRSVLERQAASLGITASVQFHGYSHDVAAFLSRLDAFVLCSVSEGLPLSVLEAMAAGLPIVGTDVGGMRDLIQDGRCGWICPPMQDDALAASLLHAVDCPPSERLAMGRRARAHVSESYSLERMTQDYERLFAALRGT